MRVMIERVGGPQRQRVQAPEGARKPEDHLPPLPFEAARPAGRGQFVDGGGWKGRDPVHRAIIAGRRMAVDRRSARSEEHTSELQSLMRISYAVFCLKKKTQNRTKPK